jgi:hypothetical protein
MSPSDFRYGFRILGGCYEPRRLVDAAAAVAGYAACDAKADVTSEAYLSAFRFGDDFRQRADPYGIVDTAGFTGPCWSPCLWWDIDGEELFHAWKDAGALAAFLVEHYGIKPGDLLLFISGSKGFQIGLPTALWSPIPSLDFHRTARRFAEHVADVAAVTIDTGVYDKARAFRAPNSRHPKTGLHKRRLTFDELLGPLDAIRELAKIPAPFAVPAVTKTSDAATAEWQAAADLVARESEAKAARRAGPGTTGLNRATLDFIRDGAGAGDRHRLLFSAAANLAEFGCRLPLAVALLEESAIDSGLPPKEVRRQIECGLAAVPHPNPKGEGTESTQQDAPESTEAATDGSEAIGPPEAAASECRGLAGQAGQAVMTRATKSTPADVKAALARLWQSTPAPTAEQSHQAATAPQSSALDARSSPAVLPPDPLPLPPGAAGSGKLEKPCRCGSREYADFPISEGRTRRDCRKCGRFIGWGKWYDQGGPTP